MLITPDQEPIFTLTTGPVDAYPEVLRALSRPVLYDYDPAFLAFYERTVQKLQTALRTAHVPVILHGEPVLALEAGAASLIARDDVVLNLVSGVYGAGFGFWAKRYCAELLEIRVPYDEVIDPGRVEEMFKARPEIRVVSVCHHDTPSGTINPVTQIGRIAQAHGAYLLVDAVSSFGGMDVDPDTCRADLFVTGPNKCLGCPPGLSLVGVTPRAWEKMKANPQAPRDSMLSILDWEHAWRRDRPFPFTPSVSEVNGLDAALDLYLTEGPEHVWARHALTAAACRAGALAMGLKLWPADERTASPTATAIRIPANVEDAALRAAARARYGVVFSSGRGETLGKLVRIGHMGPTARPLYAVVALTALGGALRALGHRLDVAAGVAAALAVIDDGLAAALNAKRGG
jgi:pyridoxamine--pyruvate transaminase